ncbi:hypothetical protein ABIF67_004387 [Bradyrhizobium japonicum]
MPERSRRATMAPRSRLATTTPSPIAALCRSVRRVSVSSPARTIRSPMPRQARLRAVTVQAAFLRSAARPSPMQARSRSAIPPASPAASWRSVTTTRSPTPPPARSPSGRTPPASSFKATFRPSAILAQSRRAISASASPCSVTMPRSPMPARSRRAIVERRVFRCRATGPRLAKVARSMSAWAVQVSPIPAR